VTRVPIDMVIPKLAAERGIKAMEFVHVHCLIADIGDMC
jgi:hypothetical protein